MKISLFQADKDLATKGVEINFGEADETGLQASLTLAYSGNENYRSKLAKLTRNAAQQIPGREIPPETFAKLNKQAMIGTVLLGWKNFEEDESTVEARRFIEAFDDNDALIEPNAMRLLNTPIIHDFIQTESARVERFQKEKGDAATAATKSAPSLES